MSALPYKRVLLKLSGEMLAGESKYGLDTQMLTNISLDLKEIHELGIELGIIVGAGNIFRGLSAAGKGMERVPADHMGMLGTVINAIALQDFTERNGLKTRIMSALSVDDVAEPYIRRRAIRHLEKGRLVIFAAGTGNPFFTTDTAAALRASEIDADILLKGTRVDGVYDKDPLQFPDAVRYKTITYSEVVERKLRVMDLTAFTFCQDNNVPMRIFDMTKRGRLLRLLKGEDIGTLVSDKA
ncbi:MAG TPA: UMP kinase [Bacteroidetes bacterium]|nr:uridylate kinase [bacterium BMS3Bbin04]HDO65857.1 UMP kinase [Bacteroidota bacterium]HEX04982.1 UMP kinase [Bacteroidota bacterium]